MAAAAPASVETLFRLLRTLIPSGPCGFEGFIADALSELTGRTFRLVKPGPQGGADLLSDPAAGEAVLAVEGKRFREETPLPLDQLRAKLFDLAGSWPDADLWVLAASRQVSADDVAELDATGASLGLDVLVMDTRPGAEGLPPLAVLCAAAPRTVAAHFPGQPALVAALAGVALQPSYPLALARLRTRLDSAEIGYDAARTAMAGWMRVAMSDLPTAKGELGSHADLRAEGRPGVDRAAASAHMDALVADPGVPRALVGLEGMGKTWAVLRWWDATAGEHGLGLPLTVWLRATSLHAETSLLDAASAGLAERTGTREAGFWAARLRRWRRAGRARLLLIVDGLNQNLAVRNWADLIQPLFGRDWRGTVALAATSRPDHWAQQMELANLEPSPVTAQLGPFDDDELGAMLKKHGLSRDGITTALLDLMRVPRLFALAARLSERLAGAGELTPEALALEDWRDRVALHGSRIALNAEEFRQLASDLGRRLQAALAGGGELVLTRRELLGELGRNSGYGDAELGGAVSELVDGGWLERTERHRFRLQGAPARLAMGLTLFDAIRGAADEEAAAGVIADFLDPLRGADLGVAVLRAAATAAIVEKDTPGQVRRALLRAWLKSQNFGQADFEAFWRLAGLEPESFIAVADQEWRCCTSDPNQDEVMAKALANASKWDGAACAVDAAVRSWMSAVLLPDTGEGTRDARRLLGTLRCIPDLPGAGLLHPEADTEGWLNAQRHAFALCSYRRRAPVADAYAAWALAGSVVGSWTHGEQADWTLRLNEDDAEEASAAVVAAACGLAAAGLPQAHAAACRLFRGLATLEAIGLAGIGCIPGSDEEPETHSPPAVTGQLLTAKTVIALGATAANPAADLGQAQTAALVAFCLSAPSQEIAVAVADGVACGAIPALARWAPDEVDGYVRRLAGAAPGAVQPGSPLPGWLDALRERSPGLAGLLSDGTRHLLVQACSGLPQPHRPPWIEGSVTTALACYGGTPEGQVDILAEAFPIGITWAMRPILHPLPPEAVLRAARERHAERPEGERLEYWLRHLAWSRSIWGGLLPESLAEFLKLARHPEVKVRAWAMNILYQSRGCEVAAVEFANSGWRWAESMEREEAAAGSILLLKAVPILGQGVLDRADPQIAPAAFEEDINAVGRLTGLLRREVAHILEPCSHSSGRIWCRDRVLDRYVECEPDEAVKLVQPCIGPSRSRSTFLFMAFPALGLCKGLLKHRPEMGAALWRSLMDEQRDGITRHSGLLPMPFAVTRGQIIDDLREHALVRARDDADLARIANAATADGDDGWLEEVIVRDLECTPAGKAGRALVLAGFMHATPRARALWSGRLARPPVPGWLTVVHAIAHRAFKRHLDALYWLDAFFKAHDEHSACAAYALFASSADQRAVDQCVRRLDALRPNVPRLQLLWHNLAVSEINEREGKRINAREKLFAGTMRASGLHPW